MDVSFEMSRLRRLPMAKLRERYSDVYGEVSQSRNRLWLCRKIIWRLQAQAEGDLSERAKQRASEIANDADLRVSPPPLKGETTASVAEPTPEPSPIQLDPRLPRAGTILTRQYKGHTVQVRVLQDGFEYRGSLYRSLSAVAKAITGSHCNGFAFFKLDTKES
mgnify:CR=1 FL=1